MLKCQVAIRVDGINLLGVDALDSYDIPFPKTVEFIINLILDTTQAFARQIIVLPPCSTRAKRHRIEVFSVVRYRLAVS